MTIYQDIEHLIHYGLHKKMISVWDVVYVRNRLFHLFQLEGASVEVSPEDEDYTTPVAILDRMLSYAVEKRIIEEDTVTDRDLFDAKIMDILVPRPSEVNRNFYYKFEKEGPQAATDYFYQLSKDSHYIRTDRIAKNKHWFSHTEYGDLEITINLSKPEKDPKAIAAAKAKKQTSYPDCLLCKENVGYAGRLDHPARDNHRIIPVDLEGEHWFLQYSPYVYYNEHAIVLSREHRPMKVSKEGFDRLLDFTDQLPHYFVGSNADLPIVGGSILSHDHFQGGHHEFPMAKAPVEETFDIPRFKDVEAGIVRWPMSVIRLRGEDRHRVSELGDVILQSWRNYSDEEVEVFAETEGEPHNTVTPIARYKDGQYELDLVLRNNRTNDAHPLGIFHPHEEVHHIKKENIGLIEVMGLAVLPGRLVEEMEQLSRYIKEEKLDVAANDGAVAKHVPWAKQIEWDTTTEQAVWEQLQEEIGRRFSTVLEHAGVFKRTEVGKEAFQRFMKQLG
ncbi:UDP-glucose--hexose-1-phosphate uridylyltransferase [Halobacillus sp. Nhm2S1]|uniref:UDP-glucose--hexose-1-phosphate uridylyltransferase n=1 Tax=Halobacillus sp. Nhm2S1 TaxID=2866716 RepID=UPI001C731016|nr:UDP-glucose--hexose-1-phosphate uridylyltransferase [Halobacillus sp. Nhm2S1]MBX0357801.1 UDP-glucose--hexose-1-phosphate uridylyltransferase [Halobacillus sp. Nhm2S1]